MPAKILDVALNSIAAELELRSGDEILSIDNCNLMDLIDYNFYTKSEFLTLKIKKTSGELEEIEIEKDFDEDLGITFESAVFDKIKPCCNKCVFCFVDQQPKGFRDSLYVKDDDYRLSYLQGTYITLTNLTESDKKRIEKMHLGPFYVSVHTTNPELRKKMLNNKNAGKILKQLDWLKKQDIPVHAQIVLCPSLNDGKELEKTLYDLSKFNILSTAIVPVGVTKFRKEKIKQVDKKIAKSTIQIASKYKNVCCSDEFFLIAEEEIPSAKYYGSFSQLSDGVGTTRILLDDFKKLKAPKSIKKPLKLLFATSEAAINAITTVAAELNKIENLTATAKVVKSTYWGENITVAGLITSGDLASAVENSDTDIIIIPSVMLKPFSEVFLDGKTLDDVKKKSKKEFLVVKDYLSVREVIEYLIQCRN